MAKWLITIQPSRHLTIQHIKLDSSPFLRGQVCKDKSEIKIFVTI